MSTVLKQITNRAKTLKRKHPGAKWTNLIKQASREIKAGKGAKKKASKRRRVSSVKYIDKGEKKNVRPSKVYRIKRSKTGTFKGYAKVNGPKKSVSSVLADARRALLVDMAQLSARKLVTVKKSVRKKLQKKISEKRSLYNKIRP